MASPTAAGRIVGRVGLRPVPLLGGGHQEAGEGVAGAALAGHDAVVPGGLQGDRLPGAQLQDRRAGGDQEAFGRVARGQAAVGALHQLQTHLGDRYEHGEGGVTAPVGSAGHLVLK